MHGLLVEGSTAWRVTRASRFALLVDAAEYYRRFVQAIERARESVLILGWDLDSRLRLLRGDGEPHVELRELLDQAVRREPRLRINIVLWEGSAVYLFEREPFTRAKLQWLTHPRVRCDNDLDHPPRACHHQKVVVVDDELAFVGGIDLTRMRYDTPEHRPDDPRRRESAVRWQQPYHDVQALVSGPAARALGDLARDRFRRATCDGIEPVTERSDDAWLPDLEPDLQDARVGIVRTDPPWSGRRPAYETARLFRAAIRQADDALYIENQFLTSIAMRDALARRLRTDDGPEIVVVGPRRASGWAERQTMDVIRARVLRRLRKADRHRRFEVYVPEVGDDDIYVHAKVVVMDERLAYVGSANFSNRSLGVDTECGVAIEADRPEARRAIAAIRDRLLGEHLGMAPADVAAAYEATGSLHQVIGSRAGASRRLRKLKGEVTRFLDRLVPEVTILDPDRPIETGELLVRLISGVEPRRA
jgi:phosphatidylserine/phosphatidylglycerophosphate/cardiolipin synthase-like enzyme